MRKKRRDTAMSIGGKQKDKGVYWLVEGFIIGTIVFGLGFIAILDYSFTIAKVLDWGKYQVLIGIILVAIGAYYIFRSFKGYED